MSHAASSGAPHFFYFIFFKVLSIFSFFVCVLCRYAMEHAARMARLGRVVKSEGFTRQVLHKLVQNKTRAN